MTDPRKKSYSEKRLCPKESQQPAGVSGEDPAALVVAVGVVRQAHCAGEISDDGGEGGRDSVLGDDVEIVEGRGPH